MKNLRKFAVVFALVMAVSLSACSNEQSLTKPDAPQQTTAKENTENKDNQQNNQTDDNKENKENKENKDGQDNKQQDLTDDEKQTIEEIVERLEKYENATAGASIKMDRLFVEIVNRCGFLETKPEKSQEYFAKKVSEVKDIKNFKQSIKGLKDTMDYYKQNKQQYLQELKDNGATWDPQIKLETLEKLIDKLQ
ncbi:hypothetical protein [uncultured Finegoldia sp.]|uniref:hypothetical protein n=1 Tax=uncultured Finegoldia sp. TaxID=328009 RepID=UPI00260E5E09|nr:hypothetical protein [uncultured Finegoldia sp.]